MQVYSEYHSPIIYFLKLKGFFFYKRTVYSLSLGKNTCSAHLALN